MKKDLVRSKAETIALSLASISVIVGAGYILLSLIALGGGGDMFLLHFAAGLLLMVAGAGLAIVIEMAKKVSAIHHGINRHESSDDQG